MYYVSMEKYPYLKEFIEALNDEIKKLEQFKSYWKNKWEIEKVDLKLINSQKKGIRG